MDPKESTDTSAASHCASDIHDSDAVRACDGSFDITALCGMHCMIDSITPAQVKISEELTKELDVNGYLHISAQCIEDMLVRELIDGAREFFGRPNEDKLLAVSKDKARRGYSPINTENFASLIGKVADNDIVEKYRIGPLVCSEDKERDKEYYNTKSGRIYFFENSWTSVSHSFKSAMSRMYQLLSLIALDLLCAIAIGVNLPRDYFLGKMNRQTSIMSANCYSSRHLGLEREDRELRVSEHTDVSMLTLVVQSDPGLQIKNKSSACWETISCTRGSLFIHVGDCLQYWSRGRFHSTVHRVCIARSQECAHENESSVYEEDRISIAYFTTPDYDAVLDWPNNCCDLLTEPPPREGSRGISLRSAAEQSDLSFDLWRKKKISESIALMKQSR